MSRRDRADRMRALADSIAQAERLRALAEDQEVVRWFKARETALIEDVLSAMDDKARGEAVARVQALRELRGHLTAVEAAAQQARRKLHDLRKDT